MIISCVHTKGGVGKSMIAVHIAVGLHEQGHRVKLIDADSENRTSSIWAGAAEPAIEIVCTETVAEVEQEMKNAEDYDYVVVDAPGGIVKRTQQENRVILFYSDFVIIPVPPRSTDIEPLPLVEDIIAKCEKERGFPLEVRILANLIDARKRASKQLIPSVKALTGLPVFDTTIPVCEDFCTAHFHGTVISRMKNRDRKTKEATQAIRSFLIELLSDMVASLNNQRPPDLTRSPSIHRPTDKETHDEPAAVNE